MSTRNAPPPPPPPVKCFDQISQKRKYPPSQLIEDLRIENCKWAVLFPELRSACSRMNICSEDEPLKYRYKHLDSLLQDGPTCGLVAISVALEQKISPVDLMTMARCEKYSKNGELFSVYNGFNMLQKVIYNLNLVDLKIELRNGPLCCMEVIESLLEGCILLVPYDADYNHSPCLKKGHKAHWAVITGIVIEKPSGNGSNKTNETLNMDNVYVTAKQGKSLHLGLWKLKCLEMSNQNLTEFSPDRRDDKLEYILPVGGLAGSDGLKGQFIMINKL